MTKIIVLYDSKTGFTEMMAKAIIEGAMEIRGIETELLKVGTPFSISKLNEADAIIVGSPSRYGDVTSEMRTVLDSVKRLQKAKMLDLSGKIGGVFGSYAWDGGWLIDRLKVELETLGLRVVGSPVSAVDKMGGSMSQRRQIPGESRIDSESLKKCRKLGKDIAKEFSV
jgi:NAD(P)H dehydrogenase (quinone)